jgi:hypothetical protein
MNGRAKFVVGVKEAKDKGARPVFYETTIK